MKIYIKYFGVSSSSPPGPPLLFNEFPNLSVFEKFCCSCPVV